MFTLEILLRFIDVRFRLRDFTRWMVFDLAVVIVAWVTEVIVPLYLAFLTSEGDAFGSSTTVFGLRYFGVLRALRCIRIIRLLSMIEDLWLVSLTFNYALVPLLWTLVFVLIIVFVFAMFVVALSRDSDTSTSADTASTQESDRRNL